MRYKSLKDMKHKQEEEDMKQKAMLNVNNDNENNEEILQDMDNDLEILKEQPTQDNDKAIKDFFLPHAAEENTELNFEEVNDYSVLMVIAEEMQLPFLKSLLNHKYRHKLSLNRQSRGEAIKYAQAKMYGDMMKEKMEASGISEKIKDFL